jgi:hypothetical protein
MGRGNRKGRNGGGADKEGGGRRTGEDAEKKGGGRTRRGRGEGG